MSKRIKIFVFFDSRKGIEKILCFFFNFLVFLKVIIYKGILLKNV